MDTPILSVENVQRSLALGALQIHILKGISFTVAPGEWIALMGPSGSGKSTLLGVLGGIDRPNQGRVVLDGAEISALPENQLARLRNEKIGVVFQSFHLIPSMTAQENVEVPLYVGPRCGQAAGLAREMLDLVGLGDRVHHLPRQLSGGEQQRVAIARALVTRPRLLLADEPTGNLDSLTGRQILTLLSDLRSQLNLTVLMVTHDPAVAACAGRCLRLIDGRLASEVLQ
jgi:putative ABC transport system ATP-binding protein